MKQIIKRQLGERPSVYALILLDEDLCSISYFNCGYSSLRRIVREHRLTNRDHTRDYLYGSLLWREILGDWKPVGVNKTYDEYLKKYEELIPNITSHRYTWNRPVYLDEAAIRATQVAYAPATFTYSMSGAVINVTTPIPTVERQEVEPLERERERAEREARDLQRFTEEYYRMIGER